MKKLIHLALFFLLACFSTKAAASPAPGDTIVVSTFSFGSPQDAWFVFPSDTVSLERILMKYTLKCNPAQSPACGEWDYLTNTILHKHTGLTDSALVNQPIYTVNNNAPDSFYYSNVPTYNYAPHWQYYIVQTATTSLNTYTVGNGSNANNSPFRTSSPVSRVLYLWKASEMTAAGIAPGNITGLRMYLQSLGGAMHNLKIRMQHTLLDSLTQATLPATGYTVTYAQNKQFNSTGWSSIQLTNPFNWNGTSNLLIEFTYDNLNPATDNVVAASGTLYKSGLLNSGADRVAAFHPNSYVNVPLNNALTAIDSAITISFWAYGGPSQPIDNSAFEAVDSLGNRVLNCHMPWSDSNVYWDCGGNVFNQYDRVNKVATAANYKGQWNHWALTKNVATGSMKIYLNGVLWANGNSKFRTIKNIKTFYIGRLYGGGNSYDGSIDEFAVFGKELSAATIQAYMNKAIDAQHPNYADLALYYRFNDGNYATFTDAAPGNHPSAVMLSGVDNPLKPASQLTGNFTQTTSRPNVVFEQGVYSAYIDSTLVIDSTLKAPIQIVNYNDSIVNPGAVTSTLQVWPAAYQYSYTAQGVKYDSVLVSPYTAIYQARYNWYRKFPQVVDYELARYITPYGNGLSLGAGFTWTYDLSDYRTLLADSVHLSAGNWQELLDIKFLLIKGTPPRKVVGIQNLWSGNFDYGQNPGIESKLTPIAVNIPANATNVRWKSRVTGHGMDVPQNCAEFCAKSHYYKVNGTQQFSKLVWRDNCPLNPLYPQGGTWVYQRSNWCPGAEVWDYNFELTPFVTPSTTVSLDHDVDPYSNSSGWDYYQIYDQLIYYGAPNFQLDAAVEDILSPSTDQMWQRLNPVCMNPVIRIKNTGSDTLKSLTIYYGPNGAQPATYNWTGNLPFMAIETVTLGSFNWFAGATNFTVTVANPNGGSDAYPYNNTKGAAFVFPPPMPQMFAIEVKTNNYASETEYMVKDGTGAIMLWRNNLLPNTVYVDTLSLDVGCYEFNLTDAGEDGLQWWANTAQGAGYAKFRNVFPATTIKNFNSDFGKQIYQQFTIGMQTTVGMQNYVFTSKALMNVYPNPASRSVMVDIDLPDRKDGTVTIMNVLGEKVYETSFKAQTAESYNLDVSSYKRGIYFVVLRSGDETVSRKVVLD